MNKQESQHFANLERLALAGELTVEAAHELRNLMQVISGFIELELSNAKGSKHPAEKSTDRLKKALQHVHFASEITSNLLRFSASDKRSTGNVNDAIQTVLGLFRIRNAASVEFIWDKKPDLPDVAIPIGYMQLVLANLLKNALDALENAPSPSVKISTSIEDDRITVEVWNSGPHIPAEVVQQIFTRFTTTKPAGRGTGLGLSVSQRVIEQAGGHIRFANIETGGVAFSFSIPIAPQTETVSFSTSIRTAPKLTGRNVLVIDDDTSVCDVLKLMIVEMGGGHALACRSGEEALNIIKRESFDAILLDLRMRGLSGQQVYEQLPETMKHRVVFITGDTMNRNIYDFLSKTKQPALYKPLNYLTLFDAVENVSRTN